MGVFADTKGTAVCALCSVAASPAMSFDLRADFEESTIVGTAHGAFSRK